MRRRRQEPNWPVCEFAARAAIQIGIEDESMKDEKRSDRELGMSRKITRRDFLNGVATGVRDAGRGGAFGRTLAPKRCWPPARWRNFLPEKAADYYPPAKMGMRGNHDGSFTFAHLLRDGEKWDRPGESGEYRRKSTTWSLSAAESAGSPRRIFIVRQAGKSARILILDNHDDFGGHAKRNEFQAGGRMVLSYGGTQSIESPGKYSDVAKALIRGYRRPGGAIRAGLRSETLFRHGHRGIF